MFRWFILRFAVVEAFLAPASRAAAPPASQPTLQTLKQEEFARQLLEKAPITSSRTMPLSELVHVRLQHGQLFADSPVKTEEWTRVALGNPLLLCTMREPSADFLQLALDDFTDPANIYVQTEILAGPGQLQLVGSWEFPGRERFVTLIEKYATLDEQGRPAPGETRLLVQEMTDDGGETINLTLTEPDWATLLREHPREVREYIRPVLAELHAQRLLHPDIHVEWQIFGARAKPDPAATAAVRKLIPLLDSESFSQRQAALRQLVALQTPGAIALMHVDQQNLSAEQSARIADVLLPYRQLSPQQASALSKQPEFLLDCMDSDDAQLRRLASQQLARVLKHPITFTPGALAITRESQLAKLRQTLLPEH